MPVLLPRTDAGLPGHSGHGSSAVLLVSGVPMARKRGASDVRGFLTSRKSYETLFQREKLQVAANWTRNVVYERV